MGAITVHHEAVKNLMIAAGLKEINRIFYFKLEIEMNRPVSITVEYYPDAEIVKKSGHVLHKYKLTEE